MTTTLAEALAITEGIAGTACPPGTQARTSGVGPEAAARAGAVSELLVTARTELAALCADTAPPPLRTKPLEQVLRSTVRQAAARRPVSISLDITGQAATASMTARRMTHGVLRAGLAAAAAGAAHIFVSLAVEDDIL